MPDPAPETAAKKPVKPSSRLVPPGIVALLALLGLLLVLRQPPAALVDALLPWLDETVETAVGVPVEFKGVTGVRLGLLQQEATVAGFRLAESFERPDKTFVAAQTVRIRWHALSYLLGNPSPITVELDRPDIRLRLDAQGRFGFSPKASGEPSGPMPHGPDIALRWRGAQVHWLDEKAKVGLQVDLPTGTATLADFRRLVWDFAGTLGPGSLASKGALNLETGKGDASLTLAGADVRPFLAYAPELPLKPVKGLIDGQAQIAWQDWDFAPLTLRASGKLAAAATSEHWKGLAKAEGRWRLDSTRVALEPLIVQLAGQTVKLAGTVRWEPTLRYDLKATGDGLALDKLAAALPALDGQPLTGRADLHATISGEQPQVQGRLDGTGLGWGDFRTGRSQSRFVLDADGIVVTGDAGLADGRLDHTVRVGWGERPELRGDVQLSGIRLAKLSPALSDVGGTVSGSLHLAGSPADPTLRARLRGDALKLQAGLPPLDGLVVSADGTLKAGHADLTTRLAGGTGRVQAAWQGDALSAKWQLHDVSAAALRSWAPDLHAGRFDVQGQANASRAAISRDWRQFQATTSLRVADARWQTYPAVGGEVTGQWRLGRWEADGHLQTGPDRVTLKADGVQPTKGPASLRVNWDGRVANLGRWLPQPQDWERGEVLTTGVLRYAGDWAGQAELRVPQLTHARGSIGSGRLAVTLADRRVSIAQGQWQHGREQITLGGHVDLLADPVLALNLRLEQADLKHLLTAYESFTATKVTPAALPATLPVTDRLPRLDRRPAVLNRTDLRQGLPERIPLLEVLEYWQPIARLYPPMQSTDADGGDELPIGGKVTAYLGLRGKASDPSVRGSLSIADAFVDQHRIASVQATGRWARTDWDLDALEVITGNGGRLKAEGEVRAGQLTFEAIGNQVDLAPLELLMAPYGYVLNGAADLLLSVSGRVDDPQALLSLTVDHGKLNAQPFDQLSVVASMADRRLELTHVGFRQGTKQAIATGTVPLQTNQPISLYLRAEDESLGLLSLFTDRAEWLDGSGYFSLHVKGTPQEPRLDGRLALRNARLYLPSMGETLDAISGDVLLTYREVPTTLPGGGQGLRVINEVRVNDLTSTYNGGQVVVAGSIELPWRHEPGFWGLRVTAKDIGIRRGGLYDGTASASLTIRNELSDPVISGKVVLAKGTSALRSGSTTTTELSTVGSTKSAPLPFRISNLRVELGEEFWVKTPIFEMQPHGMIVVDWRNLADSPTIRGELVSTKGHIYLTSYQFKIVKAQADFVVREFDRDVSPINPRLTMVIAGSIPNPRSATRNMVPVEGHLTAFLENLETQNAFKLEWRNSAGLSDEEITKVVTGRTIADVASGNIDQVASDISPLLTQALFDPITDRIAQVLQLDEINVGLGNSLSDPAFRVALTKPLFNGLSVGFSRVFSTQPVTTYSLRYRVFNNWSLLYEFEDPRDRTTLGTVSTQFNARF